MSRSLMSSVPYAKHQWWMLLASCLFTVPALAQDDTNAQAQVPAPAPEIYPVPTEPNHAVVLWSRDRCEYVLIQKADGHGIIMQFSAERLKPGDVIESEFQFSVNSGKKFTIQATGETGMLRGYKFGLSRKQALKQFPRECKAPKE